MWRDERRNRKALFDFPTSTIRSQRFSTAFHPQTRDGHTKHAIRDFIE
jgi:hypothetical protein